MKHIFSFLVVVALTALNWAALHDILKGEPKVRLEWTVVIVSGALLVVWAGRRIIQNGHR